MSAQGDRAKIGVAIVGCGDVAHRWYLPALASLGGMVEVVACCDANPERAERAAAAVADWSPGATPYTDLDRMLAGEQLDAVLNITPAPAHGRVTRAALDAGLHVYSEKPIASTMAEADELIELARERDRHLICAPAVAVTRRFRWLAEIVASDRFGRLTLAVAHHADPGPASWREYTGDPTVFYGRGVGPLVDHGIYRLHGLTMLMGPVRRVQAMGSIGIPTRVVRGGPLTGRTIEVTAPDHMLINLEFASGAIGQLLASFGTPATQAPWLELHFERATISFPAGSQYDRHLGPSIYVDDDSPLGLEGWTHGTRPPPPDDPLDLVEMGPAHFIAVLRGEEPPVLTAEHARHVLEIMLAASASIDDGESHAVSTPF
jgi:predicted dehydrogenase